MAAQDARRRWLRAPPPPQARPPLRPPLQWPRAPLSAGLALPPPLRASPTIHRHRSRAWARPGPGSVYSGIGVYRDWLKQQGRRLRRRPLGRFAPQGLLFSTNPGIHRSRGTPIPGPAWPRPGNGVGVWLGRPNLCAQPVIGGSVQRRQGIPGDIGLGVHRALRHVAACGWSIAAGGWRIRLAAGGWRRVAAGGCPLYVDPTTAVRHGSGGHLSHSRWRWT